MTNLKTALNLLDSFQTGDTTAAENTLTANYIQHNLAFGTGQQAFIDAIKGLTQAPVKATFKNIRSFTDGDYVVLQNLYNFAGAGDQVGIDVFRFENGLIAEHWDNLADVTPANPSGHTQIDGPVEIDDLAATDANKQVIIDFVRDVLRGENPDNMPNYYNGNGDDYIQHNSGIADGLSGLGEAMAAMAEQGLSMTYDKTYHVLGEGNFVLTMSEGHFAGDHVGFYDLFRVKSGKIIEHWDIIQAIPEKSEWQNENGKF